MVCGSFDEIVKSGFDIDKIMSTFNKAGKQEEGQRETAIVK